MRRVKKQLRLPAGTEIISERTLDRFVYRHSQDVQIDHIKDGRVWFWRDNQRWYVPIESLPPVNPKLKPCPFCKSDDVAVVDMVRDDHYSTVHCMCGVRGPSRLQAFAAIVAWNAASRKGKVAP